MNVSPPLSARSLGRRSPTPTEAVADIAALLKDDGGEMPIEQRFARLAAATKQHLASDTTARRGLAALLAPNEALHTQVAALRAETAGFRASGADGSDVDDTNPNDVRFARLAAETQRQLAADETARRGRAALQAQNDALQQQVEALRAENASLREARRGISGDDNGNYHEVSFARLAAESQRHLTADETARRGRAALQAQNDALQQKVQALQREKAALRASSGAGGDADKEVVASLRHELAEARFQLITCTQLQAVLGKAGVEIDKSVRKADLVKMCMKTI